MHVSYLYDLTLPSPLASAIQILHTCRALCDTGMSVDVYVRALDDSADACLAFHEVAPHPSLRLRELPRSRGRRAHMPGLRAVLRGYAGSGRHVVMSRGEPGIALLSRLAAGQPENVRIVYEAHRLSFAYAMEEGAGRSGGLRRAWARLRSHRARLRESSTLRIAHGVVCLTEGVRAALEAEFGLRRPTVVLPSGTTIREGEPPLDVHRDIDVLYAGKLDERKGVPLLVEAMRGLEGRHACIVGGTPASVAELRALARRRGVERQIVLHGYAAPSVVRELYGRARVGVCPLPAGVSRISDQFTSPLKILEMMTHGVPIVATDTPAIRALVEDGSTALLVPPNDPVALATGLRRLLEDREFAGALARRARERVRAFSWEQRARSLRRFLDEMP
jgi:glycosyltransferase involved in cell wall biosynthesis